MPLTMAQLHRRRLRRIEKQHLRLLYFKEERSMKKIRQAHLGNGHEDVGKRHQRCTYCHSVRNVNVMIVVAGKFFCNTVCSTQYWKGGRIMNGA